VGPIKGDALKFVNKIDQQFKQRKNVVAHLFTKDEIWHCFYFTYQDAFGTKMSGENHWKYGDHIHYTSHLFGRQMKKEEVWADLDKKQYNFKNLHIKYKYR
jgi:hypothetical protein